METERVPIDSIRVDPANVRKHSRRNLDTIKRSLEAFGQQKPIVVGSDGVVVAGNGTLDAARALGWTHIDVVRTGLEGSARKAYAVADNQTAALAEWDEAGLGELLASLQADETFDETVTGFDEREIARLIGAPEVVEDETPAVPETAVTRTGDLWLLGDHRVLCGDANLESSYPETFGAIVTDPPFTFGLASTEEKRSNKAGAWEDLMNSSQWFSGLYRLWARLLKNGPIWTCCNWRCLPVVMKGAVNAGLSVESVAVWDKEWIGPGGPRGLRPSYELMSLLIVGNYAIPDRGIADVWRFKWSSHKPTGHKAEKPLGLMSKCVKASNVDQVVDPFLGSGTTLIAAEQLGRKCYGIEIEPKYVDVTLKRWANLTGKQPIREADGKNFAEVESIQYG